jgi:DNA mismatch endonuclease (patch repair protein)
VDRLSKDERSRNMGAVRGRNTGPEMLVRQAAHHFGLRFRLHSCALPGRPDLVFPKWRTVIFVNGCFWHQHRGCKRAKRPKSNVQFWREKLRRNVARDRENSSLLKRMGWSVFVIWQCEVPDQDRAKAAVRAISRLFDHRPVGAAFDSTARRAD